MEDILQVETVTETERCPIDHSKKLTNRSTSEFYQQSSKATKKVVSSNIAKRCCSECHCVLQQKNSSRNQTQSNDSSFHLSCSNVFTSTATVSMPSLFRIALLLAVLNNATVSSLPLLRKKTGEYLSRLNFEPSSFDEMSMTEDTLKSGFHLSKMIRGLKSKQERESFPEVVFSRKARSAASTCVPAIRNLLQLLGHAVRVANKAHQRLKKRSSVRASAHRSWGDSCKYTHTELKRIHCQVERDLELFGESTDQVLSATKSMINLMQIEMNNLDIAFVGLSTCSSTGSKPKAGKVIDDLFKLNTNLRNICE